MSLGIHGVVLNHLPVTTKGHLHTSHPILSRASAIFLKWAEVAHLPDDRVVCGGDRVEDALDAPQRLLTPSGDAVKGFVIVLQCATTLAEGRGKIREILPTSLLCHGIRSLTYWVQGAHL